MNDIEYSMFSDESKHHTIAPHNLQSGMMDTSFLDVWEPQENVTISKQLNRDPRALLHEAAGDGRLELVKTLVEKEHVDIFTKSNSNSDDKEMPIHRAAFCDQVEIVKYFLVKRPELVNAKTSEGNRPIHKAALGGSIEVVDYLVTKRCVDINLHGSIHGYTPLHLAAGQGHLKLVKVLMEKHYADAHAKSNGDKEMPIHRAAFFGHVEVVKFFLQRYPDLINAKDKKGNRLIHKAALGGKSEVIDFLITKQDVDVGMTNDWQGHTPLHLAAGEGHLKLVKFLIDKHNADVYAKSNANDYERLPIHLAAELGHLPTVRYFLDNYPDLIDAEDNRRNRLIHVAALGGSVHVIEYLITERGVDVDLRQDSFGRTPLHHAAEEGHYEVVSALIESFNADVYAASNTNDYERLPIHLAATFGHLSLVTYFIEKYPDLLSAKTSDGVQSLHWAAVGGSVDVVNYLINQQGVDVNLRDGRFGRTALHYAAEKGHLYLVKILVERHCADIYAKSKKKDKESLPVHVAACQGRLAVVKYFVECFPDLMNVKVRNGKTPLRLATASARFNEAPQIVSYLKANNAK